MSCKKKGAKKQSHWYSKRETYILNLIIFRVTHRPMFLNKNSGYGLTERVCINARKFRYTMINNHPIHLQPALSF